MPSGDGCDSDLLLSELFSFFMAPIPKVLEFLRMRIIRFAKEVIKQVIRRFPGRGATLLAFLGRKLIEWWRLWFRTFGRPKPAKSQSFGTQASSHSVSGGSVVVREYVVAASYVPASASASQSSLHERRPAAVGVHYPVQATHSADPHDHSPSEPFGGRSFVNRSSGNLSAISIQSRDSDRLSITTNSRDSLHAPHGQPSRLPRRTRRQFGRGPDPSRSRERPTRPLSPTTPPQPAERPSLGTPASASHSSFHDRTDRQPEAVAQTAGVRLPASLSVDHPAHNPTHPLGRRSPVHRSSSAGSRSASDRLSIITNSGESMRASAGQPSRPPRTPHRQFSHDPDLSRSKERSSRSPTPSTRPHTPSHPRLENVTTNSLSPTFGQPSASSYPHGLLSPPPMNEGRRGKSFTSLVFDVQNPSTDSLPISFLSGRPQLTDEPLAIDYSTVHSSRNSSVVNLHDESLPVSPTSSVHSTADFFIPEGRFVQLIQSEQIPRYTKNATMQVDPSVLSLHTYTSLQTPRGDTLRCETFNNQIPLVRCNFGSYRSVSESSLQFSRAGWF